MRKWKQQALVVLIAVAVLPFLYSGDDELSLLEKAYQRGNLTLLTRNGASSYFIGPDGGMGPEYDIVAAFADYLGIALEVKIADEFNDLGSLLKSGQGELIAANLTRTPSREKIFSFGPDYADATTVVVYKRGKKRPRELSDLLGTRLSVIAGSSYESLLENAQKKIPGLQWASEKPSVWKDYCWPSLTMNWMQPWWILIYSRSTASFTLA